MTGRERAVLILIGALAVGSVAQHLVGAEAAVLGLSTAEVALLGLLVGSVVTRRAL